MHLASLWRHLTGRPDCGRRTRRTCRVWSVNFTQRGAYSHLHSQWMTRELVSSGSIVIARTVQFCETLFCWTEQKYFNAKQSTSNFSIVLWEVEKVVGGYRVDTVPTLAWLPSSVCRQPQPLLPTKHYHYALPATTTCRDSEARSTRRQRHPVVDLTAPTTCRRLRHLTDDAVLTPHCEPSLRLLPARPLLTAG